MNVAETELQTSLFEFTGNHLCLDFTNTVDDRFSNPKELLNSYNDLLVWSRGAQLLTEDEASQLREKAEHHRKEAEAVRQRAINLREALYHIFLAVAQGSSPEKYDLSILNTEFSEAMSQACIVSAKDSFTLDWTGKDKALDRMLWTIARSAADLLTSKGLDDVRVCAAEDCNWLFLDTSKNHSRRWCDMKSCGNRAKVRKHYTQKKHSTYV
jgi:predicted RNA-binding Zn ribbon-like protein